MNGDYPKPKELDRAFQGLLANVDGDPLDPAFVDPLILLLGDMSERAEPHIFEHYATLYSPAVLGTLSNAASHVLSYDALVRLPSLTGHLGELAPETITPDVIRGMGEVHEELAFYELILGNEDTALRHIANALEINPRGTDAQAIMTFLKEKYSRLREQSSASDVQFVTAYSFPGSSLQLGFGKILAAHGKIAATGEWSTFKRFERIIAFHGRTLRLNDPFDDQIVAAVAFAEEHFKARARIGEIGKLPREYHFSLGRNDSSSKSKTRLTGGSAGLAFALLSLSCLGALNLSPDRRRIRSNVAFTGSIDSAGIVHEVDGATLGAKVRSVFFSPCDYFVLPTKNAAAATEHLNGLKTLYPKRRIQLIPVDNVLDAYEDDRIVEKRRLSHASAILNRAWLRKRHLLAAFSSLVTAITLALLLPPRFTRDVSKSWFENGTLYFTNKYNYCFGRHDVGYRVLDLAPRRYPSGDPDDTASKTSQIFRADIDGDRSNELLLVTVEADSTETNPCGRLHIDLFESDGRRLKTMAYMDSLIRTDGKERSVYNELYYCHGEMVDLDGKGGPDHFCFSLTDPQDCPGLIGIWSFADGSLQTFAHCGYIQHFAARDFDGDGHVEVVAGGESNGLDAAVVVVLDPAHMNGSSPDISPVHFQNLTDDVAEYYIKLPRSALCSVPEMEMGRPATTRVNGALSFGVEEKDCTLIYSFDKSWRCIGIEPHSSYKTHYALYQEAYRLPDLDSHLRELRTQVEYWTGNGWTRTPTVNGSYRKLLAERRWD